MKFVVELSARAFVSQAQHVEAENAEEAEKKALADFNNHDWEYQGLDDTGDDGVDVDSVEPE